MLLAESLSWPYRTYLIKRKYEESEPCLLFAWRCPKEAVALKV